VATHVWLQLGVTVMIIEQAGGNFFAD
jgi:hypothetical protein